MVPLFLLPLLVLPELYALSSPSLSPAPLQGPSTCNLAPDSPPKVYQWTPERPDNLWELAGRFQGDLVGRPGQEVLSRRQRCVLRQGVDYWPGAVVPVDIGEGEFGLMDLYTVKKAFRIIEENTCIRFPPRNASHKAYIELKGRLGYGECWSYLGTLKSNQTLSLGEGCVDVHHALHEICHALGFVHQHSAPDRDDYIDIHWENIDPEFTEWFDKYTWDEYTDFGLGYDLYSVMHYSAYIASKNGEPTISSKDPNVKIEVRKTLSEKDIKKLNMIYCSDNSFIRNSNYRTVGCFVVDLLEEFSPLTRHVIAVAAGLWLLLVTSLAGRWLFSRVLAMQTVPDPDGSPEEGKAPEVVKEKENHTSVG